MEDAIAARVGGGCGGGGVLGRVGVWVRRRLREGAGEDLTGEGTGGVSAGPSKYVPCGRVSRKEGEGL